MEYERILRDPLISIFTAQENGDILHNMAIIKVHTTSYQEAVAYFGEAYNLNHREETLQQYMLAILLCGNMELYKNR